MSASWYACWASHAQRALLCFWLLPNQRLWSIRWIIRYFLLVYFFACVWRGVDGCLQVLKLGSAEHDYYDRTLSKQIISVVSASGWPDHNSPPILVEASGVIEDELQRMLTLAA